MQIRTDIFTTTTIITIAITTIILITIKTPLTLAQLNSNNFNYDVVNFTIDTFFTGDLGDNGINNNVGVGGNNNDDYQNDFPGGGSDGCPAPSKQCCDSGSEWKQCDYYGNAFQKLTEPKCDFKTGNDTSWANVGAQDDPYALPGTPTEMTIDLIRPFFNISYLNITWKVNNDGSFRYLKGFLLNITFKFNDKTSNKSNNTDISISRVFRISVNGSQVASGIWLDYTCIAAISNTVYNVKVSSLPTGTHISPVEANFAVGEIPRKKVKCSQEWASFMWVFQPPSSDNNNAFDVCFYGAPMNFNFSSYQINFIEKENFLIGNLIDPKYIQYYNVTNVKDAENKKLCVSYKNITAGDYVVSVYPTSYCYCGGGPVGCTRTVLGYQVKDKPKPPPTETSPTTDSKSTSASLMTLTSTPPTDYGKIIALVLGLTIPFLLIVFIVLMCCYWDTIEKYFKPKEQLVILTEPNLTEKTKEQIEELSKKLHSRCNINVTLLNSDVLKSRRSFKGVLSRLRTGVSNRFRRLFHKGLKDPDYDEARDVITRSDYLLVLHDRMSLKKFELYQVTKEFSNKECNLFLKLHLLFTDQQQPFLEFHESCNDEGHDNGVFVADDYMSKPGIIEGSSTDQYNHLDSVDLHNQEDRVGNNTFDSGLPEKNVFSLSPTVSTDNSGITTSSSTNNNINTSFLSYNKGFHHSSTSLRQQHQQQQEQPLESDCSQQNDSQIKKMKLPKRAHIVFDTTDLVFDQTIKIVHLRTGEIDEEQISIEDVDPFIPPSENKFTLMNDIDDLIHWLEKFGESTSCPVIGIIPPGRNSILSNDEINVQRRDSDGDTISDTFSSGGGGIYNIENLPEPDSNFLEAARCL